MVWVIRFVFGLCVLLALALAVSFIVAPPKNFGSGVRQSPQQSTGSAGSQGRQESDANRTNITANLVPLGATIVHTPKGAAQRSYTTRGRIDKLPGERAGYLMVHHAAIPDFLNREGKVVGMEEMIMEFPAITPDVTLDGLAVDDGVELTFEVRWNDEPVWVVTRIVELAPDAELGLGAK